MKTRIRQPIAVLVLSSLSFAPLVYAVSLRDVQVKPAEVAFVCTEIEGQHPVSIQAAVQFEMAGDLVRVYGDPEAKSYQSFECRNMRTTIYYYQYRDSAEVARYIGGIRVAIWGEQGPTSMHPELILTIDNVLVVVSGRKPGFFHRLLSYRSKFPSLENRVISDRFDLLQCGTDRQESVRVCSALADFRAGTFPKELVRGENIFFGRSWDISDNGIVGSSNFELLYVARMADASNVAAFGIVNAGQ